MAVDINSRNSLTDIVEVIDPISGNLSQPPFVDLRQRVETTAPDDSFVTVDSSMTWGNLGLSVLGDARFWWVIADVSSVIDPFTELTVGRQLRSPSQQRFLFQILAPEQTSS